MAAPPAQRRRTEVQTSPENLISSRFWESHLGERQADSGQVCAHYRTCRFTRGLVSNATKYYEQIERYRRNHQEDGHFVHLLHDACTPEVRLELAHTTGAEFHEASNLAGDLGPITAIPVLLDLGVSAGGLGLSHYRAVRTWARRTLQQGSSSMSQTRPGWSWGSRFSMTGAPPPQWLSKYIQMIGPLRVRDPV